MSEREDAEFMKAFVAEYGPIAERIQLLEREVEKYKEYWDIEKKHRHTLEAQLARAKGLLREAMEEIRGKTLRTDIYIRAKEFFESETQVE